MSIFSPFAIFDIFFFKFQTRNTVFKRPNMKAEGRRQQVLTQALILCGAGCEAIVTLTGVAAQGVEATPVLTDPWLGLTLILICVDRGQESSDILEKDGVCFFLPFFLLPSLLPFLLSLYSVYFANR